MNIEDFRRILTSFADTPADLDMSKGSILVQIRDEVIEAQLTQRSGALYIDDGNGNIGAHDWLVNRIAKVSLLADRVLTYISEPENFVTPRGTLEDQLEFSTTPYDSSVSDAIDGIGKVLDRHPAGTSSILYLTSGAGEGKTTLINHLARVQAEKYKSKKADWLLIPITLGGRTFLRFDDVVIGALVNRLRFQLFYYDAFIELVRMGVLVPAFDGFEEVFVESNYGEALSALGNLVNMLGSSGSMMIAARSAYFEYTNFTNQARLFDAIRSDSVAFAKLGLKKWDREQFIEYASKRNFTNAGAIHAKVAERFDLHHPLLTRAVLVKRLLDVAAEIDGIDDLLIQLGHAPHDYFFQFVNAIIEREANEKWIDRSGTPARPLINVEQHHRLLSMIAQEMWLISTEALRVDVLDVIADVFSESEGMAPAVSRQIKDRIKHHSLISNLDGNNLLFAFDHEDFRKFFLGESIGRTILSGNADDIRTILQIGALPPNTTDAAIHLIRRSSNSVDSFVDILSQISRLDIPTSFTRENCGGLIIRLLDKASVSSKIIQQTTFPTGALLGKQLSNITFQECYFHETSLKDAQIQNCSFNDCRFEHLILEGTIHLRNTTLDKCIIDSVTDDGSETRIFNPTSIQHHLELIGFTISDNQDSAPIAVETDEKFVIFQKVLRLFLRKTQINEDTFKLKLGTKSNTFFAEILPRTIEAGMITEIPYTGSGKQHRYKLSVPMRDIERALSHAEGNFDAVMQQFSRTEPNGY